MATAREHGQPSQAMLHRPQQKTLRGPCGSTSKLIGSMRMHPSVSNVSARPSTTMLVLWIAHPLRYQCDGMPPSAGSAGWQCESPVCLTCSKIFQECPHCRAFQFSSLSLMRQATSFCMSLAFPSSERKGVYRRMKAWASLHGFSTHCILAGTLFLRL